jgi:hypothetical protein
MLAAGLDIRDRAAAVLGELGELGLGVTGGATVGSKLHAQRAAGRRGHLQLPHRCSPFRGMSAHCRKSLLAPSGAGHCQLAWAHIMFALNEIEAVR